jgi:hypothetical protein
VAYSPYSAAPVEELARGIAFNQKKPVKSIPVAGGRHQKSRDPG